MLDKEYSKSIPDSVKSAARAAVNSSSNLSGSKPIYSALLKQDMQKLLSEKIREVGGENSGPQVEEINLYAVRGMPNVEWCHSTIAYADRNRSEEGKGVLPVTPRTKEGIEFFVDNNAFLLSENARKPDIYPGMAVYFERDVSNNSAYKAARDMDGTAFHIMNKNHVGVISRIGENEAGQAGIYVIEGNTSIPGTEQDGIAEKFYPFGDEKIIGFGDTNKVASQLHPDKYAAGHSVEENREPSMANVELPERKPPAKQSPQLQR